MGGEEWASPQSVRATITILLSAGAPPQAARMPRPPWAGVRGGWSGGCSRSPFSGQISCLLLTPPACGAPLTPSAEALQAAPGPQSADTVVIVAIPSVLLAILLTALLTLLIYTW